jgi:hypothetical protein
MPGQQKIMTYKRGFYRCSNSLLHHIEIELERTGMRIVEISESS